jgi:putative DNA primase/helicase
MNAESNQTPNPGPIAVNSTSAEDERTRHHYMTSYGYPPPHTVETLRKLGLLNASQPSKPKPIPAPAPVPVVAAPVTETEEKTEEKILFTKLPDPEPWPEPVNAAALLDELWYQLARFVILPKWAEETLALWVLHTYAFQLRDISTYIGLESPEKRCGKTTLLGVLSDLVYRPVVASNISSPAFFRVIEETGPTLLIDEADTFLQGNDELRGILNSGYSRNTAYVVRVSRERAKRKSRFGQISDPKSQLARFSCWCPKVMAAIGRLPDTLADRCIVIRMDRKTAREQCERLKGLDTGDLRRKCARFVKDNGDTIKSARPELPASLNDRAADVWEPLIVLADLAGGSWPGQARQAAIGLSANARDNSPIGSLLLNIFHVFKSSNEDRIFSRVLVEGLKTVPAQPWSEASDVRMITEKWLSQRLSPYGIHPRTMRIGGVVAKGYFQSEFLETRRRYLPAAEVESWNAEYKSADVAPAGNGNNQEQQPKPVA